jgi:hypothetical protein
MIYFDFRECIILFISASVTGFIFMLEMFPGNESIRSEMASPYCIVECLIFQ